MIIVGITPLKEPVLLIVNVDISLTLAILNNNLCIIFIGYLPVFR